ncbi:hypothetical protein M885DRAFT_559718 [Pelagophyceae sp. CCMP2097]|nr:hypothetical protein M885DRAFT_559718 [Pelagophyceae sp. CCMP2097]
MEVGRLLDRTRTGGGGAVDNVSADTLSAVDISFATIGAVAGCAPRRKIYTGEAAGCERPANAPAIGEARWFVVNEGGGEGQNFTVKLIRDLPDELLTGQTAIVPGLEQLLENVDGDEVEALTDLGNLFGRYYEPLVGQYGADVVATWSNAAKIIIGCLGAPTIDQLPVVIQRLLYVAGGCQGECPVEVYKAVQEEPRRIAKKIVDAVQLGKQGQQERNMGKMAQAVEILRDAKLEVCFYAATPGKEKGDVYSKVEMGEEGVLSITAGLAARIAGQGTMGPPAATRIDHAAAAAIPASVAPASQIADDAALTAYIEGGQFVLNETIIVEQLKLLSRFITNPKSGMVIIDSVDSRTSSTAGLSIRGGISSVATAALARYDKDRTRVGSKPQMIGLCGFHGTGLELRLWGRATRLQDLHFGKSDTALIQDFGCGKVMTRLGQNATYDTIGTVSEVANAVRNVADAFKYLFQNSELLDIASLKKVADDLEEADRAVGSLLPVCVIGRAIQLDIQQWLDAFKSGVVRPFALGDDTATMIKRHRDAALTRVEAGLSHIDRGAEKGPSKKRVLDAGFSFVLVGRHHRVFDPGEATICHGFYGEKIKKDAETYGITDDAWTLALLSSDPLIGELHSTMRLSEVSSALACTLASGAVRIIGNKSAPPKNSYESVINDDGVFVDSGPGRYLAANANVDKFHDRSYLQIEDLSENGAIIYAMAQQCGLEHQRWRAQYHLDGLYYGDERTVMGDAAAFDNGQGVTSIVARLIYLRLAPEVDALIRAQHGPKWALLAALDDFSSISIDFIGAFLDKRIPELFAEYGIKLSEKPAATRPHGPQWLSIGAQFTVTADRLDLVTSALVVWLAGVAGAPLRIFVYCDNESAVVVAARGRTRSASMGVALDALRDFERRAARCAWFVHVPGVDNVVADALSRGDQGRAFAELRRLGYQPRFVDAPAEFFTWLARIADATRG